MPLPKIFLKPLRPERYGHPWIFAGEISRGPEPEVEDGSWIAIIDHNGKPAGAGYFNSQSKIVVRRLPLLGAQTLDPSPPDQAWWTKSIRTAYEYREARGTNRRGLYRLVHAEADNLPGLIVDVYGDYVAVQFLTLGVDLRRDEIVKALETVLSPKGIYERSDTTARRLEGLEERTGVLAGEEPPDAIEVVYGARLLVDIKNGAKTGLFLDQIENQIAAAGEARDRIVLNVFSYTGLFGLRAALAGAKSVEDVEISEPFQQMARKHWNLNGNLANRCKYSQTTDNAFDDLRRREEIGYRAGMVILDPPAFTKSRSSAHSALRGYNEINRRALRILEPGGVLVTCSCSHHLSSDEFDAVILKSARDAKRDIRIIERRGQPADHPVLMRVSETSYLKMLILAVD